MGVARKPIRATGLKIDSIEDLRVVHKHRREHGVRRSFAIFHRAHLAPRTTLEVPECPGGIDLYNNFLYGVFMSRAAHAKYGMEQAGGVEDLTAVARDMREAKGVLSAVETEALVGVARVLSETAESLARTAERMEAMRPAEWMDAEQAAAYLADRSKDSFDKVAPMLPKHYLTERRPLYNRREIDEWLMSR